MSSKKVPGIVKKCKKCATVIKKKSWEFQTVSKVYNCHQKVMGVSKRVKSVQLSSKKYPGSVWEDPWGCGGGNPGGPAPSTWALSD